MIDILLLIDILYYFSIIGILYAGSLILAFYFKYLKEIVEEKEKKIENFPYVSVIIPLYNDEDNIVYVLSSVLTSNYPAEKLEVIVVDDCSKDKSYERAKMFEEFGVKVIRLKENKGAAHAKNVGIKNATGEIVITIDSDSLMDENAIRNFIPYFEDERVGGASGAIRTRKPKNLIEYFQFYEYDIILFTRKMLEKIDSIPVTPGGMSAFRKKAIEEVGYFEEKSITEDQEIAFKLQKHHYKVKCSLESFSYTEVPSDLRTLIKQRVRWIRGGIYNRIIHHKSLLSLKYGDFFIMGFIYEFVFSLPVLTLILSTLLKISITKPYFLVFRVSILEEILFSFNFVFFVNILLLLFYSMFSVYMLNFLRKKAGDRALSVEELPYFLAYIFIYPTIWSLVWINVIYKEIKKEGYRWATR